MATCRLINDGNIQVCPPLPPAYSATVPPTTPVALRNVHLHSLSLNAKEMSNGNR